jgi:methionine-rich copper-binding protein CopC
VVGLVTLALPAAVTAHADLVRANPEDGEVVTAPVTAVTGRYSEDLTDGSRLVIKDGTGATVGTGDVDPENHRRMIARLAVALREGTFTVESTARSADGHVERTTWSFTVAVPASPSPTPSASVGASPTAEPTVSEAASTSESPGPSASPAPTDTTSGTGDVLLPIIAALAIVAVGAGFLLNRSRTPRS